MTQSLCACTVQVVEEKKLHSKIPNNLNRIVEKLRWVCLQLDIKTTRPWDMMRGDAVAEHSAFPISDVRRNFQVQIIELEWIMLLLPGDQPHSKNLSKVDVLTSTTTVT